MAPAKAKLLSLELTYSWQAKPFFKEIWILLYLEELKRLPKKYFRPQLPLNLVQNSTFADPTLTPTLGRYAAPSYH